MRSFGGIGRCPARSRQGNFPIDLDAASIFVPFVMNEEWIAQRSLRLLIFFHLFSSSQQDHGPAALRNIQKANRKQSKTRSTSDHIQIQTSEGLALKNPKDTTSLFERALIASANDMKRSVTIAENPCLMTPSDVSGGKTRNSVTAMKALLFLMDIGFIFGQCCFTNRSWCESGGKLKVLTSAGFQNSSSRRGEGED